MSTREVAVVVEVGPGLGNALVGRFAEAGMRVAAVSLRGVAGETLHHQNRSAWPHENDLRPSSEKV